MKQVKYTSQALQDIACKSLLINYDLYGWILFNELHL